MPRGRMLNRCISISLSIESMSEWAQLLFDRIVIWTDDFGRLEGDPKIVKATTKPLSPRPPEEFAPAVAEMVKIGAVAAYAQDGRIYLHVVKHDQQQSGLHKRTTSRYPDPESGRELTAQEYLAAAVMNEFPETSGSSFPEEKRKRREVEEKPPVVPHSGDTTADQKTKPTRKKTATHITPEWRPREDVISALGAECPAVDVERVIPEFRDFWIGAGMPKSDWDATFRNRVRTINALITSGNRSAIAAFKRSHPGEQSRADRPRPAEVKRGRFEPQRPTLADLTDDERASLAGNRRK